MKKAALLVILLTALTLGLSAAFRAGTWDPGCIVYELTLGNGGTRYSKGYSEWEFRAIRQGMSKSQVLNRLGMPLRIIEDSNGKTRRMIEYVKGEERISWPNRFTNKQSPVTQSFYYFSESKRPSANHCSRVITFDADGKVKEVYRGYYSD